MLSGDILGFDLEWQPTFVKGGTRNPVALVQLADANVMVLIQVSAMQGDIYSILCYDSVYPKYEIIEFPQALRAVLEDPRIVKTGVAIQGDVHIR